MVMGVTSLCQWELYHYGNGRYITMAMGAISLWQMVCFSKPTVCMTEKIRLKVLIFSH